MTFSATNLNMCRLRRVSHKEKKYFFSAISTAYKPPCPSRGFSHGSVELEEVLHPKLLPRFLCWPACVAVRWYWNSGDGLQHRCVSEGVNGIIRGLQFPSSTIQRAGLHSENRISRAIQPVSNAYEDAAQTIGGRNTHGDKSGRG